MISSCPLNVRNVELSTEELTDFLCVNYCTEGNLEAIIEELNNYTLFVNNRRLDLCPSVYYTEGNSVASTKDLAYILLSIVQKRWQLQKT